MTTIYRINGYFIDSPSTTYEDIYVTDCEGLLNNRSNWDDDALFFYGVSELELQKCINGGEEEMLADCLIITSYEIEEKIP